MTKFKRVLPFLTLSLMVLSALLLPLSYSNATNLDDISAEDYIGSILKKDNSYFYITEDQIFDLSEDYFLIPQLALGINNKNLDQVPMTDDIDLRRTDLSKRLSGKFLLAVEDHGRLWYIDSITEQRSEIKLKNIEESLDLIAINLNTEIVQVEKNDIPFEISTLLKLVNLERQKYNLDELELDINLSEVALDKAEEMSEGNYFAHIGPNKITPGQRLDSFNYPWKKMGENLAKSYSSDLSPEQAFTLWMNSPKHKENILNSDFNYIGLAFYENYAVQEFVKN